MRVKDTAGELERTGASHDIFQQIGEKEFNENNGPDWKITAEHIHAALSADCFQYAVCAGYGHQDGTVYDIQAVKYIGMYGDYYGEKGKYHKTQAGGTNLSGKI